MVGQKCGPKMVKESDDGRPSADSARGARAHAGILSTPERAGRIADEIGRLHGLRPSATPRLGAALKKPAELQAFHPRLTVFALYSPASNSVIIRKSRHD